MVAVGHAARGRAPSADAPARRRRSRGPRRPPRSSPTAERARLAATWVRRAAAEYLAVSTFSVLAIDLVAAMAPADVLSLCLRAGIDEVRHAEMCLRMVEIYSGERELPPPGMSRLPDEPGRPKLHQALANTMLVSCVSETYATTVLTATRDLTDRSDGARGADRDLHRRGHARAARLVVPAPRDRGRRPGRDRRGGADAAARAARRRERRRARAARVGEVTRRRARARPDDARRGARDLRELRARGARPGLRGARHSRSARAVDDYGDTWASAA